MERFVRIVAPKHVFDFILKACVLLLLVGVFNLWHDMLTWPARLSPYLNNLSEAVFVGGPFIVLALAAFAHMHNLHVKLAVLAGTDLLTGLPNRRAFLDAVERGQGPLRSDVVLMVDADRFKQVNDRFGHSVGDICLQQMAAFLRGQIRDNDIVARMGGEEFAVLLEGTSLSDAARSAARIANGVMIHAGENEIYVTMSVGYAVRTNSAPIDVILRQADDALYRAKATGRARACGATGSDARVDGEQSVKLVS